MDIRISHLLAGARQATGLVVIIDVFRAFSLACYAFSRGVERIIPVAELESAHALRQENPQYLLVGERGGKKLPGFDYGNSPSEIEQVDLSGRTMVHTTSAGTQGLVNATRASEVITGSFTNAGAIARYISAKQPEEVSLVGMGHSLKRPSEEDTLCAEYIRSLLCQDPLDFEQLKSKLRSSDSAERFFNPEKYWAPQSDFDLCLTLDYFDFVLRSKKENDTLVLEKIEIDSVGRAQ